MKVGGIKTWKELTTGGQQLVRLLLNYNFINPDSSIDGEHVLKSGGNFSQTFFKKLQNRPKSEAFLKTSIRGFLHNIPHMLGSQF